MQPLIVAGAIVFFGAAFLGWRIWQAMSSGATAFPQLELRTRRVSRVSEGGSFWIVVAIQAALATGLLLVSLRMI